MRCTMLHCTRSVGTSVEVSLMTLFIYASLEFTPLSSLHEDFVYHWKAITNYFIDNKEEKRPIEQTNIPVHLDQMLQLLQEEEATMDAESTGPCMEYMLQHKLLETLYTLARTDFPPGMKQTVLVFFSKLLSRIKQPLLPLISVHRAVHRLMKICGEIRSGPSENEEIKFLCTVCAKIKMRPHLVNFFIDLPKPSSTSIQSSHDIPKPGTAINTSHVPSPVNSKTEFSLVNSLLSLSQSVDARVAVKSCEGLMLCATLPDNNAATAIVKHTKFCRVLTERLCTLFAALPTNINPSDLEHVQAKWGLDIITDRDDTSCFTGKRQLISFLSWFDYCDQLISIANPLISEAFCDEIRKTFLDDVLQAALLQLSESGEIAAAAYLTCCVRDVTSQQLLKEFSEFILGDDSLPERPGFETHSLRQKLIDRCNHPSEEVSVVSLKLFDALLSKEDEHIIHNLILRNLLGRAYCQNQSDDQLGFTAGQSSLNQSDDRVGFTEEQSSLSQSDDRPGFTAEQSSLSQSDDQLGFTAGQASLSQSDDELPNQIEAVISEEEKDISLSSTPSPTMSSSPSRPEILKVINSYLSLLPEEAKSSYQTTDTGYDAYLKDAHRQFAEMQMMCKMWKWPTETLSIDVLKLPIFYEGAFLKMILDKLAKLLNQSYLVNLQLTSVLSHLCLIPHPNIHEYMLDPDLQVINGARTPWRIYQKVVGEVRTHMKNDSCMNVKLLTVRKELMGIDVALSRASPGKQLTYFPANIEDRTALEAIIVLEEFCKELSAIAFVKHYTHITGHV